MDESELQDFFEEFDELAAAVAGAHWELLPQQLRRWFTAIDESASGIGQRVKWLLGLRTWEQVDAECFIPQDGMGPGKIEWPDDQTQRLSSQLNLFMQIARNELDLMNFAHDYFYVRGGNINDTVQEMIAQIYVPFVAELRRYLRRNVGNPLPTLGVGASGDGIPASDRIVVLDHNRPDYAELRTGLLTLIAAIQQANDFADTETKDQRVAELSALQELLKAPKAKAAALIEIGYKTLVDIGTEFKSTIIAGMAGGALGLLGRMTGLW